MLPVPFSGVIPALKSMSTIIAPPQLEGLGALITAVQVLSIFGSYSAESGLDSQTPYSKFAIGKTLTKPISSKLGMFIIYFPSMFWLGVNLSKLLSLSNNFDRKLLLVVSLFGHFTKRVFETLFIHKYSGNTDAYVASGIGFYYLFVSWFILHFQKLVVISKDIYSPSIIIGTVLFLVGEIGNFYHHFLLSNLRKNAEAKTKYINPTGGLFDYVATPHYFFELVAWLGIALIAQQGNALLVFFSMSSYLVGRSVATNRWNSNNIKDYKNKKNIIPLLF